MLSSIMSLANARLPAALKRAVTGMMPVAAVLVAACTPPEAILKGTRIGVLPEVTAETADPAALAEGAGLP